MFKTESNKLNDETTEVMVVGSRSRAIISDSGYLVSGGDEVKDLGVFLIQVLPCVTASTPSVAQLT